MPSPSDRKPLWGWAAWLMALALVGLALAMPHRVDAGAAAILRIPVELPLLVLVLAVVPSVLWRPSRAVLAALLGLMVALAVANLAADFALARPFNLLLDMHLASASVELLTGALGAAGAFAVLAVAVLAWIAVGLALYWALGHLRAPAPSRYRTVAFAGFIAAGLMAGHWLMPQGGPALTTASASRLATQQVQLVREGLQDRRLFAAALADDVVAALPMSGRLDRLAGKDVVLLFVESYGRISLDDPRYGPTVHAALADFERAAGKAGFLSRSAWLTSSIFGGQSWLAHSTLLSGLRIDHQRRYELLLVSGRQTLVGDFARAGWRTLGIMPAMTRAWPEGGFYRFDRIYQASDFGYRGEPFNWVTMPDQFSLAALRRLELVRGDRPPVMATMALISSHAPWTPIPPLLDWSELGDGSVFTPYVLAGDPPPLVWSDPDRVRAQYLKSIDYVLRTLQSYVSTYGDDRTVFIIVGDHQPARIVSGEAASLDVPIHILARSPEVMAAIADWGWSEGMTPDTASPVWAMEDFRQRFVRAFTRPESSSESHAVAPPAAPLSGQGG